jgi:hypothetical protein
VSSTSGQARTIACPLCHRPDLVLTPSGRLPLHRLVRRPSKACTASGLLPEDVTS